MAKRKKHPRLPNGFGSIRYLGRGRANPYAVHPPAEEINAVGDYVRPAPICYVDDWYVGFAVLNAYHAGTYNPGDELLFKSYRACSETDLDAFCARLLADHTAQAYVVKEEAGMTFSEVYDAFYKWKYEESTSRQLSRQSRDSTRAAYGHFKSLHEKSFKDLRHDDFQNCINNCNRKSATKENMVSLINQMFEYALLYDIVEIDRSIGLRAPACDDESGVPFSQAELKKLIDHKEDPVVEFIIIMCFSGFRISAYADMEVNTEKWFFHGGLKTVAGRERTVPIHSFIRPMVLNRLGQNKNLIGCTPSTFRKRMYEKLEELGIKKHTPHDCRHTFSWACEKCGVSESDRKRMLGHSFGSDITNKVYGHRTLEELRGEVEKITVDRLMQPE